jgi:hypothetical protein
MPIYPIVFPLTPLTFVPMIPISWTLSVEVRGRICFAHSEGERVPLSIRRADCGRADESSTFRLKKQRQAP